MNRYVLNPILIYTVCRPLYSIPCIRRRLKRHGLTFNGWIEHCDALFEDPEDGFFMRSVNGGMTFILMSFILIGINVAQIVFGTGVRDFWWDNLELNFLLILIFCLAFCHVVFDKKDRYLKYFSKFEKEGTKKTTIWCIGTLIFLIVQTTLIFITYVCAEKKNGFM